MKKVIIGVVIALVFIAGGVGAYLVFTNPNQDEVLNNTTTTTKSSNDSKLTTVNACDVLTEEVAKEVIGESVKKITPSTNTAISTPENTASNCYYVIADASDASSPKMSGATLIVYSAKSHAGGESNKAQFANKSSDVQQVEGIGDDAFYNPEFRQLHVLKGNNWYILTNFKDTIMNSSLESNKQLAEKLEFK